MTGISGGCGDVRSGRRGGGRREGAVGKPEQVLQGLINQRMKGGVTVKAEL